MDMNEFKSQLNEANWKECLQAIIFDNNMTWVFDDTESHYDEATHKWVVDRYIPPEETLVFCDDGVSIKKKEKYPMKDRTNPLYNKAYYWSIRHVENVQGIICCDEDNKEIRPFFDASMM